MLNFDSLYEKVNECSSELAFSKQESYFLYQTIMDMNVGSLLIEVGIEYGRSTTIFAEVAKHNELNHIAIDNFCQDDGQDYKQFQLERFEKYDWYNSKLREADSADTSFMGQKKADLVLIDADHAYESVLRDARAWIPKLKKDGIILFHDYGRDTLPGVKKAIDKLSNELTCVTVVDTLGAFVKKQ